MSPADIHAAFERAVIEKRALEIRHHGDDYFMRFSPHSCGTEGATGYMDASSNWPRSTKYKMLAEVRDAS